MVSPQMTSKSLSHSQNKETELKKREKKKKSVEKRDRKKRDPKVSHEKGMDIFREEKNSNFKSCCVSPFYLFFYFLTLLLNCSEKIWTLLEPSLSFAIYMT
jgi:hypothetical protein